MPPTRALPVVALLVCLCACSTKPQKAPALGEAFVAPVKLELHADLSPRSSIVANLKHGEKIDVLQIRRRFVKIRSKQGVEGWTDNRQLMSTRQMDALRQLIEAGKNMPSQGRGTVFESLNVHTEPNRQAPSYCQVPENGSVEVIARRVLPRAAFQGEPVVPPPPSAKKTRKKDESRRDKAKGLPPPPRPDPPALRDDWLDLSLRDSLPEDPRAKKSVGTKAEPQPLRFDDWVLVRTKDGQSGWVLARMVSMAIPDEVAQYAEGARITSYFSLGETADSDGNKKHHWLWTTLSVSLEPYQFDGFRVFVFNTRHNRYETAYREKNVIGYYPIETKPVEVAEGRKKLTAQGFSLIVEDRDGQVWKRTFAFQGYRVRALGKEPWKKPVPFEQPKVSDDPLADFAAATETQAAGWWQKFKGLFGKK